MKLKFSAVLIGFLEIEGNEARVVEFLIGRKGGVEREEEEEALGEGGGMVDLVIIIVKATLSKIKGLDPATPLFVTQTPLCDTQTPPKAIRTPPMGILTV